MSTSRPKETGREGLDTWCKRTGEGAGRKEMQELRRRQAASIEPPAGEDKNGKLAGDGIRVSNYHSEAGERENGWGAHSEKKVGHKEKRGGQKKPSSSSPLPPWRRSQQLRQPKPLSSH